MHDVLWSMCTIFTVYVYVPYHSFYIACYVWICILLAVVSNMRDEIVCIVYDLLLR